MVLFLKTLRLGKNTGISFVDSTPIRVCHNKRIHNHEVFKVLPKKEVNLRLDIFLASSFI